MVDKQLKTLTVRIPGEKEREAIRYVMRESGCGRAAQAVLFACTAYQISHQRDKSVIDSIRQNAREQNRKQQRIINSLMEENERLRHALKVMQDGIAGLQATMNGLQKPLADKRSRDRSGEVLVDDASLPIPPEQGTVK